MSQTTQQKTRSCVFFPEFNVTRDKTSRTPHPPLKNNVGYPPPPKKIKIKNMVKGAGTLSLQTNFALLCDSSAFFAFRSCTGSLKCRSDFSAGNVWGCFMNHPKCIQPGKPNKTHLLYRPITNQWCWGFKKWKLKTKKRRSDTHVQDLRLIGLNWTMPFQTFITN